MLSANPVASAADAPKISISRLGKTFAGRHGPVEALHDIDIAIAEGEFCCIVGPSGCGKTTLLRIIAGLEEATAGEVNVRHADPAAPVNAMIFQEQSVFPWLSVRDNIGYGLRLRGVATARRREVVERFVAKVGLAQFADAFPHQLSGGLKQRVSVARAFANDPEVLLMDEPFASLDEQNRILLQQELLRIWEEDRKTVVFITHSIEEAIALGDRVVVMTAHPGRLKAEVRVTLPRPRDVRRLRGDPAFAAMVGGIWEQLWDEVVRAQADIGAVVVAQ